MVRAGRYSTAINRYRVLCTLDTSRYEILYTYVQ
jgi:hypothetical protein